MTASPFIFVCSPRQRCLLFARVPYFRCRGSASLPQLLRMPCAADAVARRLFVRFAVLASSSNDAVLATFGGFVARYRADIVCIAAKGLCFWRR
jgi:hypothetical protein